MAISGAPWRAVPHAVTSLKALLLMGSTLLDLHPSSGRCPERESPHVGTPFFLLAAPPNQPGQALLQLCALPSLAGLRRVTRVVLGSHSLDSRHVWGRHGADFFGFLKGMLLVKGLLFLLLVLQRKEGIAEWGVRALRESSATGSSEGCAGQPCTVRD